jgi:hypothetical protein
MLLTDLVINLHPELWMCIHELGEKCWSVVRFRSILLTSLLLEEYPGALNNASSRVTTAFTRQNVWNKMGFALAQPDSRQLMPG